MSLRELPPEQAVRRDRWRHLRYVPLIALMVAAVLAATGGFYVTLRQQAAASEVATPSATASSGPTALPASCTPAVDPPAGEPWMSSDSTHSETTWAEHADELSEPYVIGRDGFVFWGDIQAENFSQAVGRRYLSAEELATWRTYLTTLRDGLAAQGVPLYVVVAPAKWGAYPDELPAWTDGLVGSSALDQLLAANPDLPFVDLRAPLRDAARTTPVYSRVNSHWTDYGAAVAWTAISGCIAASDPDLAAIHLPETTGVTVSDGGSEFAQWGLTSPVPDWTTPEFAEPLLPVSLSIAGAAPTTVDGTRRVGLGELPARTWTDGAQADATALVVRDSFGVSLAPYLQQSFARTVQVRHMFDYPPDQQPDILALSATEKPDVVILEIAQRHLEFPPPVP
ncbi:alginate O-acetyltransferase AlgX-related protein [Protaetiibacter mangrovi]|uniref:AlgX/AlgJ SGNH hydrolase-like domain-containing protein n=1 Tax=Protaetiibacter mangrovi TaxID=2970926 RepID=A0ABT1ZFJ9_9MICO|nr:hypothetical protein [Protaetiibacter mangrovi]MCS0499476.1 hypothetical protein [Protaetiibacter mangrovi]